jgi:hypothetical protein
VDFDAQMSQDFIALRLISAKLMEARMLAASLQPDTQQALDQALEHVERELGALDQIRRGAED